MNKLLPFWFRRARCTLALLLVLLSPPTLLTGCISAAVLKSSPAPDISAVKRGAHRDQVELLLGGALREWQSVAGVTFCLYEYKGAVVPRYGQAAGMALWDIFSFGIFEAFYAHDIGNYDDLNPRETLRSIVSYDEDSNMIGIFGENDALPADGRPR